MGQKLQIGNVIAFLTQIPSCTATRLEFEARPWLPVVDAAAAAFYLATAPEGGVGALGTLAPCNAFGPSSLLRESASESRRLGVSGRGGDGGHHGAPLGGFKSGLPSQALNRGPRRVHGRPRAHGQRGPFLAVCLQSWTVTAAHTTPADLFAEKRRTLLRQRRKSSQSRRRGEGGGGISVTKKKAVAAAAATAAAAAAAATTTTIGKAPLPRTSGGGGNDDGGDDEGCPGTGRSGQPPFAAPSCRPRRIGPAIPRYRGAGGGAAQQPPASRPGQPDQPAGPAGLALGDRGGLRGGHSARRLRKAT